MTSEDVYSAADIFLKALDAAPIGTGAILKEVASKDRMETLVLRAISKLYAASYHCSNVARLVQSAHEEAKALARALKHPTNAEFQTTARSIGAGEILQGAKGAFPVQEIAFEIDAFLAASRGSIDFGGRVVGLHLGIFHFIGPVEPVSHRPGSVQSCHSAPAQTVISCRPERVCWLCSKSFETCSGIIRRDKSRSAALT